MSIADGFIQFPGSLPEYGALSSVDFVTLLYQNVLDRAPDPTGLNSWLNLMSPGNSSFTQFTRAMVVVGFAKSPENIAKTSTWLIDTARAG